MRLHLSCLVIVAACGSSPPPGGPPVDEAGPSEDICDPANPPELAWAAQVISANDAARILRDAERDPDKARQLAIMREIFYVADLSWASGSEADAGRLLRRFEDELRDPHYVSAKDVRPALAQMERIANEYPPPPPIDDPEYDYYGWKKVTAVLEPALSIVPSKGEAFEELLRFPSELVVPFLIRAYQSESYYHPYNMHNELFVLLTTSGFGYEVLAVVEARLRDGDPDEGPNNIYGVYWNDAVEAATELLGKDVSAWYCSVRGTALAGDRLRHANAGD